MPELEPTPIEQLFARNPLDLEKRDIAHMVDYYRTRRKRYILGDTQAGNTKAKPASAKTKALAEAKKAAGPIDISSLL